MSAITKAVPKALLTGIRDESRRALVPEPEQLPQHLPLLYLLTERGPTTPQMAVGDGFSRLYGIESLNARGRYFNHQSALATIIMGNGNRCMVQRVKPSGATTAKLRISVEVIRTELPKYLRNTDGTFQRNSDGDLIQDGVNTVEGFELIWHKNPVAQAQAFGSAAIVNNYRTAGDGTGGTTANLSTYTDATSTLYPIMDLEVPSFGEFGNRQGLRLSAPNSASLSPGDSVTMAIRKAFMYRLSCLERPTNSNTASLIQTNGGDLSIDLTLKENVIHPRTNLNISMGDMFIDSWQDLQSTDVPPKYGPFGKLHIYQSHLATVLEILRAGVDGDGVIITTDAPGELDFDADAIQYGRTADLAFGNADNLYLLNIFTGVDINGVPYDTFTVANSVALGGIMFDENVIHYASGGDDGLTALTDPDARLKDLQIFDSLVAVEAAGFGDLEAPLLDSAKYPISAIWDSGFSFETKKTLLVPMSRRKDIYTVLATQAVAEYDDPQNPDPAEFRYMEANDQSSENSFAVALRTAASLYPESTIHGTATCRAVIIGHCGKLVNSDWKGLLPMTLDFANKVSRYMGAGDGRWVSAYSFDESPTNQVSLFRPVDVNLTYKSDTNYNKDWDAGLNWVQSYDRNSLFFPAFQTVYPDDTSVLNAFMVMAACVEAEHVSERVWRDLTGGSKLTREQFIERSNRLIDERMRDRFDGRFVVVPETFFTEADDARGYSWSTRIHIYANNMRTVGSFTVVAHRMEDLGV